MIALSNDGCVIPMTRRHNSYKVTSWRDNPCASKSFCLYMCYQFLHIVWKWLAGTRGGEIFSYPKTQVSRLGNCSCFYFRQLNFFKIHFLQINHPGPSSDCQTVRIQIKTDVLLVFIRIKLFPKVYCQTTKFSTGMQIVITGKYLTIQYYTSTILT